MFGRLTDWCVMNRGRFGELSFSFALTHLWVVTVIMIANVLYFAGAFNNPVGSIEAISVVPGPLADALPQLTASSGLSGFFVIFLGSCVFAPFVEEAMRAAILQAFCEKRTVNPKTGKVVAVEMKNFFLILAMSVFFFGMIHGGYLNIFIQGVLGLLMARLWFRVGVSQKWQYLSMVAVHAAYNFSVLGTQLMVVRALN